MADFINSYAEHYLRQARSIGLQRPCDAEHAHRAVQHYASVDARELIFRLIYGKHASVGELEELLLTIEEMQRALASAEAFTRVHSDRGGSKRLRRQVDLASWRSRGEGLPF